MKRDTLRLVLFCCGFLLCLTPSAPSFAAAQDDADLIPPPPVRKALLAEMARFGLTQVDPAALRVKRSSDEGMFEVQIGTLIFYSNRDGSLTYYSTLVDLQGEELTEEQLRPLRKAVLPYLNEDDMIVYAPPPGQPVRYTLTLFIDVNCPFCARFHRLLPELHAEGIKVRYMAFPNYGLASDTYQETLNVWCNPDRASALARSKRGMPLPLSQCAEPNPVDAQFFVGESFAIEGTPSIVFENGAVHTGTLSVLDLLVYLGDHFTPPPRCDDYTPAQSPK